MADGSSRPRGLGDRDLLTDDELARHLGCGREKALAWARERGLALPTPGAGLRFEVGEVNAALKRERDGLRLAEAPAPRRAIDRARRVTVD
jgi:hypothetical protein